LRAANTHEDTLDVAVEECDRVAAHRQLLSSAADVEQRGGVARQSHHKASKAAFAVWVKQIRAIGRRSEDHARSASLPHHQDAVASMPFGSHHDVLSDVALPRASNPVILCRLE
jgi:HPt (histidine-containing phosphotransfer) domain-containing protein